MKTSITLIPLSSSVSTSVGIAGAYTRSLGFRVRSNELNRVVTTGGRSLDTVAGHVSFETVDGLPDNPTWGKAVFFPADEELPEQYGIEVRAPLSVVEALARDARHALPTSITVEIEGLDPDFSGPTLVWRWLPDPDRPPSVLTVNVGGSISSSDSR